jgi:hypothetical protein
MASNAEGSPCLNRSIKSLSLIKVIGFMCLKRSKGSFGVQAGSVTYGTLWESLETGEDRKKVMEKIMTTAKHLIEGVNLPFISDVDTKDIDEDSS